MGVIITSFIIPYIRSKTIVEKQIKVQNLVDTAVFAAEKLVSGSSTGSEKKQFVLNFMKNQGKTFDLEIIDAMIESTVEKLNLAQNKDKPKSTSVVVDKEKSA